jgi:hypothetical protein
VYAGSSDEEVEMYVVMGVHHPKAGMEKALLEVQKKFGVAQRGHRGLVSALARFTSRRLAARPIIGLQTARNVRKD